MAQDPWAQFRVSPAQPAQQPVEDPIIRPRDPYKDRDQALQEQANNRANDAAARQAEAAIRAAATAERGMTMGAIPSGYRLKADGTLEKIPGGPGAGGKPLPEGPAKRVETDVSQYATLTSSLQSFQDDYAGNTITGGLENTIQGQFADFGTPGQRNWWADFQRTDNAIRNELFGATLTPSEQRSYENTTITPSMDPKIIRENLRKRAAIVETALERRRRFLIANGYDEDAVNILFEPVTANRLITGKGEEKKDDPVPAIGSTGQPPSLPQGSPPIPGGDEPTRQLQQGATKSIPIEGVQGRYRELLGSGASADELIAYLQSVGINNQSTLEQARIQAEYRDRNPNVPVSRYRVDFTRDVPVSAADQALNYIGQSGPGAYAINAADALSAGTLDNIAGAMGGNEERIRSGMSAISDASPIAAPLGQVSGGVMASLLGEAGLARAGMAGGLGRGVLADASYGAASGAGNADGGNRGMNALLGAGTSAFGSAAGAAGTNALIRGLTPTGEGAQALYAAGVRPTIGQRGAAMAEQGGVRGAIGNAVNTAEQKLQSIPVVGSAIRGARQEARDQFQIGAFNEALKEVGEQLPKGMKPGTAPNAYAQKTFERIYAEARSGMRLVADEELANDIANLAGDVEVLGPQARAKLKGIIENNVTNRFANGELSGEMFKKTVSDLEKRSAQFRRGSSAEDQALGDVITEIKFALDAAARRHSDEDAVALLDAADAGYAKLVRIEGAAARAGGDAGTFTPSQFDREVQKQSGGVRSRAYSRGDALMQDYAQEGKALVDTVPDSGTPGRLLAGAAAGGAVVVSSQAAAILGGLLTAYAPGGRKLMQKALSPAGPRRKAIARQLEKRARLVGSTTAASAAALSPGTSPSP